MVQIPSDVRVVAVGFWLPIGRSNFFDAGRDFPLIQEFNAYRDRMGAPLSGYDLTKMTIEAKRLNSSVYRRLVTVVPNACRFSLDEEPKPNGSRYTRAYPMYNTDRLDDLTADLEPDTIALVCTGSDLGGPEWATVRDCVESVTLVLVSEGVYVWLALYHAAGTEDEERLRVRTMQKALKEHVYALVGGPFFNRSAEQDAVVQDGQGEPPSALPATGPKALTLTDYRTYNLGILSFFQINVIFEGLFNGALDPQVFFDSGAVPGKADDVLQTYSLGKFVGLVTTDVRIDPEGQGLADAVIEDLWTLLYLPTTWSPEQYFRFFKGVREHCVNPFVRRDILRAFLSKTAIETVNLLQLRIESCARSLVGILIKSAHLRRPVVQTENPPPIHVTSPTQVRYLMPAGANEGQLTGYVMLLTAKLPVVHNAQQYLENSVRRLMELAEEFPADVESRIKRSVAGLQSARAALLERIKEDVNGLGRAIEQAYMDSMLAETEKMRSEQETMAEIARIRERTGGAVPETAGVAAATLAGWVAIAAAFIALVTAIADLPTVIDIVNRLLHAGLTTATIVAIAFIVVLVLFVVFAFVAYLVLIPAAGPLTLSLIRNRRQHDEAAGQYYYEMDLRVDASMDPPATDAARQRDLTQALLAGDFDGEYPRPPWCKLPWEQQLRYPIVERENGLAPQRNSYRVNRIGADEATHKIYVVANVYWQSAQASKRKQAHSKVKPKDKRKSMRLYLVYEVMFHSPSDVPTHLLKTFRLVATMGEILSADELDGLKQVVLWEFVNRWVAEDEQKLQPGDAFLSVSTSVDKLRPGGATQAVAQP